MLLIRVEFLIDPMHDGLGCLCADMPRNAGYTPWYLDFARETEKIKGQTKEVISPV